MIRRILLVDDDPSLTTILGAALSAEGFEIEVAHDGAEALRRLPGADLAILDVLLPEIDGFALCRRIRGQLPVIFLSSRGEEIDRVAGLELGADDYVTKPFSTRELCARIRSLDRRLHPTDAPPLEAGPLRIDTARFQVTWQAQPVALTRSELQLLSAMVERRGFVLSREQLLERTRGVTITERTVDTFVKRIRKKLRDVDPAFDHIETVFGVGYRYRQ